MQIGHQEAADVPLPIATEPNTSCSFMELYHYFSPNESSLNKKEDIKIMVLGVRVCETL